MPFSPIHGRKGYKHGNSIDMEFGTEGGWPCRVAMHLTNWGLTPLYGLNKPRKQTKEKRMLLDESNGDRVVPPNE
eukprot:1138781-Pelagomonas_calceolata.AAC.10